MEYNIASIIEEKLKEIYGLSGEDTGYLYKYLLIRAACHYEQKKIPRPKIFQFILDEINISTYDSEDGKVLMYKDKEYKVFEVSLELIDHFEFRAEMEGMDNFREELEEIFKKGYQKAQKYRKSNNYKKHLKLERLNALNSEMGANPIASSGIKGFLETSSHNPFKRTLEEELISLIETNKFQKSTSYISEKDLEEYLSSNIELLEKDMTVLKTQYEVNGGTIDILARDKNGILCVIELKIEEDKSIVWQSIHYPNEIKKEFNLKEVRMITLQPSYSSHMKTALKMNNYVELYGYNIETEGKTIVKLEPFKIE